MIVCSGPGVFAGDLLRQTVHVGRGARVVLTSQAALQVHPSSPTAASVRSAAILRSQFVVDENAELHCHWDPVIPFAGARLDQQFDVRIRSGSALYWSDAIMAGRVSRDEAWRFDALAHELALRTDGSLSYLERYELRPTERDVSRAWIAGAARYLATILVRHPNASSEIAERWHRALVPANDGVRAAVDLVAPQLIAARVASADGAPFSRFRASYRATALDRSFAPPNSQGGSRINDHAERGRERLVCSARACAFHRRCGGGAERGGDVAGGIRDAARAGRRQHDHQPERRQADRTRHRRIRRVPDQRPRRRRQSHRRLVGARRRQDAGNYDDRNTQRQRHHGNGQARRRRRRPAVRPSTGDAGDR